ncbi:unnamed protein product [Durusdinium trenchii]|uniref:Uncharacterized protein n=1 Tax=Durusdinium trenchii TaxID=1381693 RepID=A0ABP0P5Z3_9DINO
MQQCRLQQLLEGPLLAYITCGGRCAQLVNRKDLALAVGALVLSFGSGSAAVVAPDAPAPEGQAADQVPKRCGRPRKGQELKVAKQTGSLVASNADVRRSRSAFFSMTAMWIAFPPRPSFASSKNP